MISHYTTDFEEYLDRVGAFLRRRPVEHGVLLSTATTRVGDEVAGEASNLWLWVEDDKKVVAAAQLTPPYGAYLSTGPAEAMRELARTLWQMRSGLPGVAGLDNSPQEFADEWSQLGDPQATPAMGQGLYVANAVSIPHLWTGAGCVHGLQRYRSNRLRSTAWMETARRMIPP